jgi:hypothetical protein
MRKRDVATRLAMWDENLAVPERVELLARLSRLYERDGVLVDGRAPSLHRCCPDRVACWARDGHRMPSGGHIEPDPAAGGNGSIFWPWIGSSYRAGGLCLVGWNLHHEGNWWAPLIEEYVIAGEVREEFESGRKRHRKGGGFGYGAMASAAAILASAVGEKPDQRPSPQSLVDTLDQVARVQTVKCAPVGARSRPSREMVRRCPSRFFLKEVAVLEPGVLLALGVKARDAIGEAAEVRWRSWQEDFQRGEMDLGGHRVEVFAVPHPGGAWGRWPNGQKKLVSSLKRRPLAVPG